MKKTKIVFSGFLVLGVFVFGYIKYNNININDVGLNLFGWVKKISGRSVDLKLIENKSGQTINHQNWSNLLKKYVDEKGKVNYDGFIKDSTELSAYLDLVSHNPPNKNWTEQTQLSYWINAYNAFTIKLIIDNYPLKSIKEIGGGLPMINSPWDIKFFKIGNVPFDLNTIEHEILRKKFDEPRIHFAINCASSSCPKLRNEAYSEQKLESQLEDQADDFINNSRKNSINELETKVSKIFDWFKSDFTRNTDLVSFISRYNASINAENKVEYLEYNWNLNN